ncbi:MAG: HNH endonuclease [Rhizobiaceae bacterium]
MEHLTRADFERFWRQVNVGLAEHCWEFKGFLNKEGYGKFATRANGKSKNVSAHRVAYRSIRGPLTKGLVIRHLCHNPACCNPAHLEEGTHQENMRDMWTAGRGHRNLGETATKAILTADDVKEIVRLHRSGVRRGAIVRRYGVHTSTIKRILEGSNWQHITQPMGIVPRRRGKYPLHP